MGHPIYQKGILKISKRISNSQIKNIINRMNNLSSEDTFEDFDTNPIIDHYTELKPHFWSIKNNIIISATNKHRDDEPVNELKQIIKILEKDNITLSGIILYRDNDCGDINFIKVTDNVIKIIDFMKITTDEWESLFTVFTDFAYNTNSFQRY